MDLFKPEIAGRRAWNEIEDRTYLRLHQNESSALFPSARWNDFVDWLRTRTNLERALVEYPDVQSPGLTSVFARLVGAGEGEILLTAGSTAGIELIAHSVNASRIALPNPTFFAYERFFASRGARVVKFDLDESGRYLERELHRQDVLDCEVVALCSPNNPTGAGLSEDAIARFLESYKGLLILDEAFLDYASEPSFASRVGQYENLIVLRTLSKAWGLASLRVGFLVANQKWIDYLARARMPFTVTALSQAIAEFTLRSCEAEMRASTERTVRDREWLEDRLRSVPGTRVFKSHGNFVFFSIGDARRIAGELKRNRILVQVFELPRVGACLRVSVSAGREALERLVTQIAKAAPPIGQAPPPK